MSEVRSPTQCPRVQAAYGFKTRAAAESAAREKNAKRGRNVRPLRPYKCLVCRLWHLGVQT